jgi:hypothetical protein
MSLLFVENRFTDRSDFGLADDDGSGLWLSAPSFMEVEVMQDPLIPTLPSASAAVIAGT